MEPGTGSLGSLGSSLPEWQLPGLVSQGVSCQAGLGEGHVVDRDMQGSRAECPHEPTCGRALLTKDVPVGLSPRPHRRFWEGGRLDPSYGWGP